MQHQSTNSIHYDHDLECRLMKVHDDDSIGNGISSEDLLYEIFVRLPLISLLRFKSVSKFWYSLILNIGSFLRHRNISSNNNDDVALLLVSSHHKPIDAIDPALSVLSVFQSNMFLHMSMITDKDEQLVLNNSCNGLLLYHHSFSRSKNCKTPESHDRYNVSSHHSTVFYVCNPITKHYIKLPNIELKDISREEEYKKHMKNTRKACIVFDPSVSNSYKVIRCCLQRECCYNNHVLYVYSSEKSSWKLLTRFTGSFEAGFRTALLNGVFYWYAEVGNVCLRFDIENENVSFPPLPTNLQTHRTCHYFGEYGGRLHLIEKYHTIDHPLNHVLTFPCSFNIMEMEEQDDGRHCVWTVKYRVHIGEACERIIRKLPKSQRQVPFQVCIMHLYEMTKGKKKEEEEEEEALLINIMGTNKAFSLNVTSNTFGEELIVIPNMHRPNLRGIVPFTPTLAAAS